MTGSTAGPRSRGLRGLLLLLGVVSIMALVFAGTAFAVPPSNIGQALLGKCGVTEAQLPQISDGYEDDSWHLCAVVTRAEYAKFVAEAFGSGSPISG